MQFVLPAKYTVENAPTPKDPRVSIKELPARKLGVIKFSGNATAERKLRTFLPSETCDFLFDKGLNQHRYEDCCLFSFLCILVFLCGFASSDLKSGS
jgi:hypothetical protein